MLQRAGHPFDQFVTRELSSGAYLRHVDDFALLGDSEGEFGNSGFNGNVVSINKDNIGTFQNVAR